MGPAPASSAPAPMSGSTVAPDAGANNQAPAPSGNIMGPAPAPSAPAPMSVSTVAPDAGANNQAPAPSGNIMGPAPAPASPSTVAPTVPAVNPDCVKSNIMAHCNKKTNKANRKACKKNRR